MDNEEVMWYTLDVLVENIAYAMMLPAYLQGLFYYHTTASTNAQWNHPFLNDRIDSLLLFLSIYIEQSFCHFVTDSRIIHHHIMDLSIHTFFALILQKLFLH